MYLNEKAWETELAVEQGVEYLASWHIIGEKLPNVTYPK